MNPLEKLREICLAYPGSTEGTHYGEIVFSVGDAMFASAGAKRGPPKVIVKLDAEHAKRLVATDKRFKKYTYEPNGVAISGADVTDWKHIAALVEESHRICVLTPLGAAPPTAVVSKPATPAKAKVTAKARTKAKPKTSNAR